MKQSCRVLIWLLFLAVEVVGFTCAGVLSAHATDAGLREQTKAYEESCISTLRTINVAQITYSDWKKDKGFARKLAELGPAGERLIDEVMASGEKDGYRFRLTPEHKGTNRPVRRYTITARPIKRLIKDQRSFFTDETGVIRFTTVDRAATATDLPINPGPAK